MTRSWTKSATVGEAVQNAWRGIREAFMMKSKIWIALACAAGALVVAWVLQLSALAVAVIVLTSGVIVAAEMFNTSLEALEDIVFPEYREAVRRSKDLAAGAVLFLSLSAVIVGLLLLGLPLLRLFF